MTTLLKQTTSLAIGDEYKVKINGRTLSFSFKNITPLEAEHMLASSPGNRASKNEALSRIISDMERDEYYSHLCDPLRFTSKGELIDGHHRLMAIVETGISQVIHCIFGYDYDDMIVIDQNKSRTIEDILKIQGKSHRKQIAPAIKWIYIMLSTETGTTRRTRRNPGNKDGDRISRFFSDDTWNAQASYFELNVRKPYGLPSGPLIALKLLYDRINLKQSQNFWDGLFLGKDNALYSEGDPRRALIRKIRREHEKASASNAKGRVQWDEFQLLAWFHYTWKRMETDKPIDVMRANSDTYWECWEELHGLAKKYFPIDFGGRKHV